MNSSRDEIRELSKRFERPKKIPFSELPRYITGISTPIFGVSWEPPKSEREIVRKLIVFLEDRRALYTPYDFETVHWATESILKIRDELTGCLQELKEDSEAVPSLRAMRAACRQYLSRMELSKKMSQYWAGRRRRKVDAEFADLWREAGQFETSLGELRAIFGIHIAKLCAMYGIDLEGAIVTILPPAPEDEPED